MMENILFYLIFVFYAVAMGLSVAHYEKRIKKAVAVHEAVRQRRRLRYCIRAFTLLLAVVVSAAVVWQNKNRLFIGQLPIEYFVLSLCLVMLAGVWIYGQAVERFGAYHVFSKNEFLQKYPAFVLFLRAFEADDYDAQTNRRLSWKGFSEDEFVRELRGVLPCCAVGMTKEAVAPKGASRVYVSDETWQTDVWDLMERAERIVILVEDRPSCVWEMRQCIGLLGKTAFIVANHEKYISVRQQLTDTIALPLADENVCSPFYVYSGSNRREAPLLIKAFENSLSGYDAFWSNVLGSQMNAVRQRCLRKGMTIRLLRLLRDICGGTNTFLLIAFMAFCAVVVWVDGNAKVGLCFLGAALLISFILIVRWRIRSMK